MFKAIADGFGYLFGLIGDMALYILNGLLKLLQPILDLVGGIFYFVYMLGVVLVKVLLLFVSIAKLLIGLLTGLFKTIVGFSYSGSSANIPSSYNETFSHLQSVFQTLQIDKIAYLLMVTVWIATAFAAVKIIGGNGGGASE
jgi:hypothetical protein